MGRIANREFHRKFQSPSSGSLETRGRIEEGGGRRIEESAQILLHFLIKLPGTLQQFSPRIRLGSSRTQGQGTQ